MSTGVFISDRRLYLAADEKTVVEQGDPKAAFLLVPAGGQLPMDRARSLGLVDPKPVVIDAAPKADKDEKDDDKEHEESEEKAEEPESDKALKPAKDKAVKPSSNK